MSVFNLFIISMAAYLPLSQCKDKPLFILPCPPPRPQPPFDPFPVKNPHNCLKDYWKLKKKIILKKRKEKKDPKIWGKRFMANCVGITILLDRVSCCCVLGSYHTPYPPLPPAPRHLFTRLPLCFGCRMSELSEAAGILKKEKRETKPG